MGPNPLHGLHGTSAQFNEALTVIHGAIGPLIIARAMDSHGHLCHGHELGMSGCLQKYRRQPSITTAL